MTTLAPSPTLDAVRPRRVVGPALLTALAVAFGLTLRWWQLGSRSLWFDEGYTAWVVSLRPADVVRVIRVDTAPPLYYLLLRAWVSVAGHGEVALRAPSAACATVALGVMTAVVWRLFQRPWARAVGVAVVACSPLQVAYAHEARFYAALGLCGAVNLYSAIRACERQRVSVGWLVGSAIGWAVGLWLNNIMLFYLPSLAVAWLVLPGDRPVRGRVLDLAAVGLVAAVLYLPWVPSMLAQRRAVQANFWSHPPGYRELLQMARTVAGASDAAGAFGGVMAAAAAVAVVAASVGRRRWRVPASLALAGLLPLVVTFAYSRHATSIFMDRAFIVSSLVVPVLGAVPIEAVAGRVGDRRTFAATAAGLFLIAAGCSAVADRHQVPDHVEDWRRACRCAAGASGGPALVVFNANEGELLFDYYVHDGGYSARADQTGTPAGYFDRDPPRTMRRVRTEADMAGLRDRLLRRPGEPVVFVAAHTDFADPGRRTLRLLRALRVEVERQAFDAVTVYRFEPRRAAD